MGDKEVFTAIILCSLISFSLLVVLGITLHNIEAAIIQLNVKSELNNLRYQLSSLQSQNEKDNYQLYQAINLLTEQFTCLCPI